MSERQRRLEKIRQQIVDVELPMVEYFSKVQGINPSEVTREYFEEFQFCAAQMHECCRRSMQAIYDLIDTIAAESPDVSTLSVSTPDTAPTAEPPPLEQLADLIAEKVQGKIRANAARDSVVAGCASVPGRSR